ncbi:hypothetical protein [Pseudomonas amygdali]|uniref:hypothetical protein n=1 Tax=Pseudomonas amygdali TaxID=47877 RepID=UPI000C12CB65|nr:hypothetical protein [Pseudomonas amygdali]PHX29355.1 hypothetical protein AO282_06220 [Pseudomonas amygdali pv. morsprunorum]
MNPNSKLTKIDFYFMRLGIGTPSGASGIQPLYLTYAADRESGKISGFILTCDRPTQQHRLILCCRLHENVASPTPWRLSFDGCAPWFPGVAKIHTSDTHAKYYHNWIIDEADDAFFDFITDLPLRYFRRIIECSYFPPTIANACFEKQFSEHNLLVRYYKFTTGVRPPRFSEF